jgi:hypothetical protein
MLALAILPLTWVTARAWIAFGGALGAVIGLPSEYRYVHYRPDNPPLRWQAGKVLIGLGVAGALLFGLTALSWSSPVFDAAAFALTSLWLTLGAPALFNHLGLACGVGGHRGARAQRFEDLGS